MCGRARVCILLFVTMLYYLILFFFTVHRKTNFSVIVLEQYIFLISELIIAVFLVSPLLGLASTHRIGIADSWS